LRALLRERKRDPAVVLRQLQAIITGQNEPRPALPGSEIVLTHEDCVQFLRKFCGIKHVQGLINMAWPQQKPRGFFWPVPCHKALTYDRLAELIVKRKVPHYDWVPDYLRKQVDRGFDCRGVGSDYILWTPTGIESREACPELREISYRDLWQMKGEVLNCREAVILWLLVYWKTQGQVRLDPKGWTRTSSRLVDGHGVHVRASDDRLYVLWDTPGNAHPDGSARSAVS